MKLKDLPKYATMETILSLTLRQRQILYRQCENGKSCYLVDVNYGTGGFYQNCFYSNGHFRGAFITDNYAEENIIYKEKTNND